MAIWNLNNIYNFKDTEKLVSQLKEKVEDFRKARQKLSPNLSVQDFMGIIQKSEEISVISARLSAYAGLWLSESTADSQRNAHSAKISEICTDLGNEMIFFTIWFKEIDEKTAENFIKNSGKYHYMLERVRAFKKHSLKEKEEQIINLKDLSGDEALTRIYDIITNRFVFDFEGKKLSIEELNQHKSSPDRSKRKLAYDLLFARYAEEESVLGEIYKDIANDWRNENIKLRTFSSPISVMNHYNDVPDKAIDALLKVVRKNVALFQEYFVLKSKISGIEIDRYDLYAPYSKTEKQYPYEDSKKIVLEVYREFSEESYEMAKKIFDDQHVHSDLMKNKRMGAFCMSVIKDMPPYILLNHVGKLRDVFTMAHEFGHGIHSMAARDQTQFTFHSALPMAETASIFGEMLLAKKLLKSAGSEEKKAVLMKLLEDQYASIARQAFFVIFEKDAHEQIAMGATVEELNELYIKNLREQFGKINVPDNFQHEWKYIPHIYHTPFYCYAYAFGNLLVLALYNMFEKEGKSFVPKYLKILSSGGSESSSNILKEVGIDITQESFWQQGFDIIKEEIEELKKITS